LEALLGVASSIPSEQLAEEQLMRWHVERQRGWLPLGKRAFTDVEYYTTLERGLDKAVTLAEACALTGYQSAESEADRG
jgi:hypothetical protein